MTAIKNLQNITIKFTESFYVMYKEPQVHYFTNMFHVEVFHRGTGLEYSSGILCPSYLAVDPETTGGRGPTGYQP